MIKNICRGNAENTPTLLKKINKNMRIHKVVPCRSKYNEKYSSNISHIGTCGDQKDGLLR